MVNSVLWLKKHRRILSWSALVLIIAFGIYSLKRVDPFSYLTRSFYEAGMGPVGLRMDEVQLKLQSKGIPVLSMTAARIDGTRNRQLWQVYNVKSASLFDKGKPTATFSSATAKYDTGSRTITAEDSSLEFKQGKLNIKSMVWRQDQKTIFAAQPSGTLRDGPIKAQTAEVRLKEGIIIAEQGVWQPKSKEKVPLTLGWDHFQAEQKSKVAVMEGVSISDDAIKASADHADYQMDTSRIIVSGNIRIVASDTVLLAETPSKPTPPNESNKTRLGAITASKAIFDEAAGLYHLEDFQLIDGDTTLKAERGNYNKKTEIIEATGSLMMSDPKIEVHGDKLTMERKRKYALVTGNLNIIIKSKKDTSKQDDQSLTEAKNHPITITAEKLEYYYGSKRVADLTGAVKARQQLDKGHWRNLTADKARFDRDAETLTVIGNVVLTDDEGAELHPQLLIVYTKEGAEKVEIHKLDKGRNVIPLKDTDDKEETAPPPFTPESASKTPSK
ncbi:MAG: LptA/OstA family protein [bacterium]